MGPLFSKNASNFVIHIKTGDQKKSGTDANVQICLYDDKSNSSDAICLDNAFRDDFERGQLDTFKVNKDKVTKLSEDANITRIEVWRDDAGLFSNWMVDTISVENRRTKSTFIFPIFRWIKANRHYNIKHLDTSLPQFDEFPEQRKQELEDKRQIYEYEEKLPGIPVQVKNIPDDEQFSFSYKWDLLTLKFKLVAKTGISKLLSSGQFESIEEITKIYDEVFEAPKNPDGWKNDVFFGYQRIASHNPTHIKLATQIPDKFPVTDDMVGQLIEGLTLQDAIAQKRLFICDYEVMDGLPTKDSLKICHPIGLLFVNKDQDLVPIAIQLYQNPAPNNPIFTPQDPPLLWSLVKMWFNNADAAYHQSITHLGYTHLKMEGFAIASHRALSQSHPIFKLLAPHFLYIIAINNRALTKLLPEGQWIDNNMNAGTVGTHELAGRGCTAWRFDVHGILTEDLKNRGLDDPKVLPKYHFREDALELYQAIFKYVSSYVNHYYSSTDILNNDNEINNWMSELAAAPPHGVGLKGLPGNGKLTSTDQLAQILTCVINICSVSHAAANFPQYDQYCCPPNYPALLTGNPPTSKTEEVTEKDILKSLPNRPTTLDTMVVTKILSTKGTQSIGEFEVNYVYDTEVLPFLEQFKKDLKDITARIKSRNEKREYPYDYLDPQSIPNSISI